MVIQKLPKELVEARSAMIVKAPFFSFLLFERSVMEVTDAEGKWRGMEVSTACTDGYHIVVNMDWFGKLNASERVFVLCHEVFHLMARHPSRGMYYHHNGLAGDSYSHELGNIAMDAVINKALRDAGVGKQPQGVNLEPELKALGYTLTGMEAWEDVYEVLKKHAKKIQQQMQGQGQGMDANDVRSPNTAGGKIPSESEMKASIQSAAEAAKATGNLPGNLKSFLDEFLEPKVDWREELASQVITRAKADHYDWSRSNRHKLVTPGIIVPRLHGITTGPLAISVDTSGSVSDHELREFLSEASSIFQHVSPEFIKVIWCDAQVDRVDHLETAEELLDLVRAQGAPGRGGPPGVPPFKWLQEHWDEPEPPFMHIYMTDGYGPFPDESDEICPTIWLINNNQVKPPFGKLIVLD
jgi:predicted metal-dependent peptidase